MTGRNSANTTTTRRRLLCATGVGLGGILAGCESVRQLDRERIRETRTVDPSKVAAINVADATGDVAFIGESRDNIKIVSQKHATGGVSPQELDTEVQVVENRLEITTDEPQLLGLGGGRVALELRVPRNVAVHRLHTNHGDVTGVGVTDGATLEAPNGDVSVSRARGDVSARSTKGDITVDGTEGDLSAKTSDGTIQVRGPMRVAALTTQTGDITADVPAVVDDALVESSAGDLLLRLSEGLSATLSAHTSTGEFSVPNQAPQFRVHQRTETQLRAEVERGTSQLTARTEDGDITIRA
ncbi:DUF4097 family beta strand repeat-containing protein [Halorubrum aquaticum]|uniref:DUF4097 family beta strand repeat-containing protein n=1 Tax=Halorubrum aquaticum TaxID=387340 RepID=UPI00122D207C|nr:DUF4097 family beta strand repeat-containing protein [Halorubrum aquaticum]